MTSARFAALFALGAVALASAHGAAQSVPSPAATATPLTTPRPVFHFVFTPSPAPDNTPFQRAGAPEIHEIDLSDAVVPAPGDLHVRVLTSSNVVSVTATTMGHDLDIPALTPGVFRLDAWIPDVPQYMRNRNFDVQFVAAGPDGRTANVTLPLALK
ncbi:MAG TPA: hypothetical protein VKG44_05405 [Candidatus Baltobacteraceae bacterium]|nr:hypothetical protein [Candidatus Baltobacteraceae bacterium]